MEEEVALRSPAEGGIILDEEEASSESGDDDVTKRAKGDQGSGAKAANGKGYAGTPGETSDLREGNIRTVYI